MGTRYLVGSNVVIDFCNGKLPQNSRALLSTIDPEISIITNIELFGTKNIPIEEFTLLEQFAAISTIHPVNPELVKSTIEIR